MENVLRRLEEDFSHRGVFQPESLMGGARGADVAAAWQPSVHAHEVLDAGRVLARAVTVGWRHAARSFSGVPGRARARVGFALSTLTRDRRRRRRGVTGAASAVRSAEESSASKV